MEADMLINLALDYLTAKVPFATLVFTILGALMLVGQTYIALTPGKGDDEWAKKLENHPIVGKILLVLASFAPWQKKPPKA